MPLKTIFQNTPIFLKFLGIVLMSISVCAFFIGYMEYFTSKDKLATELGSSLKHIAVTGAIMLDGDSHESITSKESPAYAQIQETLRNIKTLNELEAPIYTLRRSGKKAEFVVSTEQGTLLGGEYALRRDLMDAFDKGKAAYTPIYRDKNGIWISAYAPIRDKGNNIVAVLEIDHHVGVIVRELNRRLLVIIISCGVGFLFSLILTIPFLRSVTLSMRKLSEAAGELEKGNYDYRIDIKSGDEIGHLAEAFRKMRISIKEYIKELKETHVKMVRGEKLAAIGKLASSVGHELRNPLGVMRNSIYFIKMKLGGRIKDEKVEKHLAILEEEISNSDRIISNLLEFSRVKEPALEKVKLNDLIKEAVSKIELNRNVKAVYSLDENLPEILADGFQIKQVVTNLLLNANNAMPEGGTLTLGTSRNQGYAEIKIEDTGQGIPEKDLENIFEPLFSTKPKGTGLGLSICHTIVESHKGEIRVKSKVGEGSSFTVRLPLSEIRI